MSSIDLAPRRLAHPGDIINALREASRQTRKRVDRRRERSYYAAYNARYSTRAARADRKSKNLHFTQPGERSNVR